MAPETLPEAERVAQPVDPLALSLQAEPVTGRIPADFLVVDQHVERATQVLDVLHEQPAHGRVVAVPSPYVLARRARERRVDRHRDHADRHAAGIHGFFRRRTGNTTAAFELTAETFAAAWLARPSRG
jgi:hypothetical protein